MPVNPDLTQFISYTRDINSSQKLCTGLIEFESLFFIIKPKVYDKRFFEIK